MFPDAIHVTHTDLHTSTLPFAIALCASHRHADSALTALTDNTNSHPLPRAAPKNPSVPSPSDLNMRLPRAQKAIAAVVHSARWMEAFGQASLPHRALLLSQSQQGANFAFTAVPSLHHGAMHPTTFITALQRRLRLPLSVLFGINGLADPYGDDLLTRPRLLHLRTGPWHDAILHVVARMCRMAGHYVSMDCRRPRAVSAAYSPLYCPDASLPHAAPNGAHVLIDVTTAGVTTRSALPSSAQIVGAAASSAEGTKRGLYGDVSPNVLVPFAVEEGGALGQEAMKLLKQCKKKCRNNIVAINEAELNWSNRGFSNWSLQSVSLANVKGIGHFFTTAAAILRST